MATAGILGVDGAGPPAYSRLLSAAGLASTTSLTPVVIPGLSVTPPAGTYLVVVHATLRNTNNANSVAVAINAGGVLVPDSGTSQASNDFGSLTTLGRATVNGAQSIDAIWSVTGASGEITTRTMFLLNVENN